jgi:chromosome segregation protein
VQLKTLEIVGFKSFANRTVLHFDHGTTGIVGPNGSGKSNISEAIRWALGEQSAKSLRGDKMADVIFAGSATRHPLNRATVTLTFDNQDHTLSDQHDEVEVQRILYRDGSSAFKLNQKSCRLKDIVNLFMDSGLGRESFSIISQGKIAAIFNSKPEDRRGFIEETAGVALYKQRKHEAELQLKTTAANLERVSDIVTELAQQMEPLKEQSSIATDYLQQKKQLDQVTKTLLVRDITAKVAAKKDQQVALKQVATRLKQAKSNEQTFQKQLTQSKKEQQALQQVLDQQQQQRVELTQQLAQLSNEKELAGERRQVAKDQLASLTTQVQEAEKALAAAQAKFAQQAKSLQQKRRDLQRQRQALKSNTQQAQTQTQQLTVTIKQQRDQYIDQLQQQTTLHNEAGYLKRQLAQLAQQLSKTGVTALEEQTTQWHQKQTQAQQQATALQQQRQQLQAQLTATKNQVTKQQQQLEQAQQNWLQALKIKQKAEAQFATLKEMQASYTGFYNGVRLLLQQRSSLPGLIGAVTELIQVPDQYLTAIETALGGQAQALITETQTVAKQAIELLKQKHAGRATFLPLDALQHRQLTVAQLTQAQQQAGFCGCAADLITFEAQVAPALQYLLGRVLVVDTLPHGITLANQLRHQVKIVTLTGDILNPGGTMVGGSHKSQNRLLAQRQQQDKLQHELQAMNQALSEKEQDLNQLKAQIATDQAKVTTLTTQSEQLGQQVMRQNTTLATLKEQAQAFEQRQRALTFEQQQTKDQQAKLQQQQTDNQQQQAQLTETMAATQAALTAAETALTTAQQQQATTQEQQQQRQTAVAVAQEQVQQLETSQDQLATTIQQATNQLQQQQAKQKSLTQQVQQNSGQHQTTQQDLQTLQQQLDQLTQTVQAQQTQRQTYAQQVTQQEQQLAHAQASSQQERGSAVRIRTAIEQLDEGINQALTQLSQTYALSYEAAQAESLTTATTELQQQAKLLKRGLADLGNVNLGAIETYQQLKKRYDFLNTQQADLLEAQAQLDRTMHAMDQEVAQRFMTTFDATAKAFAVLFPKMFGGGQATLKLTSPDEPLTTGIDIIVQPPGKKLQQLSLLSGGEQALTAITLLFALIEVRPVPLCILDEVEAALDEANVVRFGNFLKHYHHQTQFIVITHRKGTMMALDVLYGVTMQESGVSTVVSVSVEAAMEATNS